MSVVIYAKACTMVSNVANVTIFTGIALEYTSDTAHPRLEYDQPN